MALTAIPAIGARRPKSEPLAELPLFPLRTRWTLALNAPLAAPPAFAATRAFFPIEGGRLVAYDLAAGTRRWLISIETTIEPTAAEDLVFVPVADSIVGLNADDGSVAWRVSFADRLATPLVYDGGWLIAATKSGSLLAYRARDGQLLWRRDIGSPAHARPGLSADHVFVPTEDGRVLSLRLDTGDLEWEHHLGGAANDLLPLDDRVFVGSKDNYLYALRSSDGEKDWRWRTGADVIGLPVVDERSVYFVSLDNVLRALNRGNGVQRWKRALSLRPTSGPILTNNTLLVNGLTPTLFGFNAKDGSPAGNAPIGAEIAAPPHIVPDATTRLAVIYICRQTVEGASVISLAHSLEPELTPVAPLPNLIDFGPKKPPTPLTRS